MISVEIKLYPKGDKSCSRLLGKIDIVNDGTGTLKTGNYRATLSDEGEFTRDGKPKVWKIITLKGFKRQKKGPYHLLLAVLRKALGK